MKRLLVVVTPLFMACLLVGSAAAQGINFERDRMKQMLSTVSNTIEKNYYDSSMKGLNWKQLTQDAARKIDQANSPGQMLTAIFALVDKLQDSHTVFIPPEHVSKALFGFSAKAFGDQVRIFDLTKGGAAEKAGLQRGDELLVVNGYNVDRASYDKMMLFLKVLRPVSRMEIAYSRGGGPPQTVQLAAEIKQGTVLTDLSNPDTLLRVIHEIEAETTQKIWFGKYDDGIAWVQLPEFNAQFAESTGKHLDGKAAILDLRGNPGGVVDSMRDLASHLQREPGSLADTVGRKKSEPLKFKPSSPVVDAPLYVLIDSESSSCAEILARYLQLTKRATLIGDRSSGRVLVANLIPQQVGVDVIVPFAVEVSIGKVVMSDGNEIEGRGVQPDLMCLPSEADLRAQRDPCLLAAHNLARTKLGLAELDKSQAPSTIRK